MTDCMFWSRTWEARKMPKGGLVSFGAFVIRDRIPRELQMLYEMANEYGQKLLRRLQSILECKNTDLKS